MKQTIPYHLFLSKKCKNRNNENNKKLYFQLAAIYANRYAHQSAHKPTHYLYNSTTEKPTEVIQIIDELFLYNYLLKHCPAVLTYGHGNVLSFSEFIEELGVYFFVLKNKLFSGEVVNLPHYLGIIKVQSTVIKKRYKKFNKILPKKIITLQWQKKFFENRLLNVVDKKWFSVKIKDKTFLNEIYYNMISNSLMYDIGFENISEYSKKIKNL